MSAKRALCYWTGYANHGITLEDIPDTYQYVNLFLINIEAPPTYISTDYISSDGISWDEILQQVKTLQGRGVKVLATLMSQPNFNFNQITDPQNFAANTVDIVINQWGLDGIDIDPEIGVHGVAEPPNQNFIQYVTELRNQLGSDKLLTYVSYILDFDSEMLQTNMSNLDWVSLMGYFWSTNEYEQQFNSYTQYVPSDQLLIGVSPADPQTPLSEVATLCNWQCGKNGGGMMLFSITYDIPQYSGEQQWAYTDAIGTCLSSSGCS